MVLSLVLAEDGSDSVAMAFAVGRECAGHSCRELDQTVAVGSRGPDEKVAAD